MVFDPEIHHRHSIRLKGYNYSSPGNYFVTICTQNRECILGIVEASEMKMNDPGKMVEKWWLKLSDKFETTLLDKFIIMPNHIQGIIKIREKGQTHGSAPTLGEIIRWFKTMSTNEYIRAVNNKGWPPFNGKLWQRNYYDVIVRIKKDLHAIRKYINNNPAEWENNENNPKNF